MAEVKTALVIGDLGEYGESLGVILAKRGIRASLRQLFEYSASEISAAVVEEEENLGSIDALYYCAAVPSESSEHPVLLDIDEQDWDLAMNQVPKGFFLSCKYVLPYLMGSDAPRVYLLLPDSGQPEKRGVHVHAALSACHTLLDRISGELAAYGVVLKSVETTEGWLESV